VYVPPGRTVRGASMVTLSPAAGPPCRAGRTAGGAVGAAGDGVCESAADGAVETIMRARRTAFGRGARTGVLIAA
jgi:hypothetical protein